MNDTSIPAVGTARPWSFPRLPGAASTTWSQRRAGTTVNLKSCELQLRRARHLLADVLGEVGADDVLRYPVQDRLLTALAARWQLSTAHLALAAGTATAIGAVVDAFAVPAGRLLLHEPAFDAWAHAAALRGVAVTHCPGVGPDHGTTLEPLAQAMADSPPAVVALTNPGNPGASLVPLARVRTLAALARERGHLLVVDDCYGDFAGSGQVSALADLDAVLVLHSLSKSWALAGARLGVVAGRPDLVDYLQRFRLDSAVSGPALAIATALAARPDDLEALWTDTAAARAHLTSGIARRLPNWRALPSVTNFVTVDTGAPGGGGAVETAAAAAGFRLRGLDDVTGFAGCFRVGIADTEVLDALLDALVVAFPAGRTVDAA